MTRINIRDYLHFPEENDCTCEFESNLDQKNEMQEAFMLYDKDGDGLIDTKDIGTVIRSLGQVLTVCEETDIVAQYAQEKCCKSINYSRCVFDSLLLPLPPPLSHSRLTPLF